MKINLYDYQNYSAFIRDWISQQSSNGRGQLTRLAKALGIHTSTLSQVLNGSKNLTIDQSALAADFFGLNNLESQFFLSLVLMEKSATNQLRLTLRSQMKSIREQAKELTEVIPQDRPLSDEEKAVFYSNWYYAAIWAQTDIPGFQTREQLQNHFQLPRKLVNEVVSFLVATGLCEDKRGQLKPGYNYTHLESASPLLSRHHANWRIEALKRHHSISNEEICYTSPMTISMKDAARVRYLITEAIAEINKISRASLSEELRCLNIDWIRI